MNRTCENRKNPQRTPLAASRGIEAGGLSGGRRRPGGFTLIETLVAMMLLAISLVVILQLFSGGLKSARLADDYTRAVFHAREKMEEHLLKTELEEGSHEGRFDDNYRWKVEISLVKTEDEEDKQPPVDMFNVEVAVFWLSGHSEKSFRVATLQIAEKKDDAI